MTRTIAAALLLACAAAAQPPTAEISNRSLKLKLVLPDRDRGYYRGTRFDWSGQVSSLTYQGHQYFGVWFPKYDPLLHDAIQGPVEEFVKGETSIGYDEAQPGDTFLRLGVGMVRRIDAGPFQRFSTYPIVNHGTWTLRPYADRYEFVHELKDSSGYGYRYEKTLRLDGAKPRLTIDHVLRNTGRKALETSQYNHNFFTIDGQPTGPDFQVIFPFAVKSARDLGDKAAVEGNRLIYKRELETGESAFTELSGFGATAKDFDLRIENTKTKAGVRIRGDRPIEKIVYWSIRTTLCPEPYIALRVPPGGVTKWRLTYDFYTLP
ncbi:MAG TPA: hypothetical protein DEH78_00955 [Solibacterales bacterium]|nr:hypothetical protein [Bryobacterales bacterium]